MSEILRRYLPVLDWGPNYRRDWLAGDAMAGLITAIMLVPQSMAYAMLAGLPPQTGLYASILPLVLYGLMGSSRALAVGPVAIVSLMTASTLTPMFETGSPEYIGGALMLAVLSGVILLLLGLIRAGFLVSFISHPVISGFTSAAAIVIGLSQIRHLLGLSLPRGSVMETVTGLFTNIAATKPVTFVIGIGAVAILMIMKGPVAKYLGKRGISEVMNQLITKSGPLIMVAIGTLLTAGLGLSGAYGVATVGDIPRGLPGITMPGLDVGLYAQLAPAAALIGFVGFLESISVAKALAARRRQKVDANQELRGLGAANIGAAFTGGYPVTGGFSRSMVNFAAGANTPLASILTALLVAVSVLLLTPLFFHLPRAVLAAIIVVAVAQLVDFRAMANTWRYSKADAVAQIATFGIVLLIGVEAGILAGIALSLILYLWRTSQPHFAVVGQVGDSEHYRNVERHKVRTDPEILLIRVDENLYFANSSNLEERIQHEVAERHDVTEVVLICSAVNFIDASALEALEELERNLQDAGVTLHLAEIKGPVMDRLRRTHFLENLSPGQVFLSTHDAVRTLREKVHSGAFDPGI